MSTTRRRLAPEVRSRRAAKRRRARNRRGMTKEDKLISSGYRLAIANDPCFYCGKRSELMHTDHFISLARGGTSHWYNLVRACAADNYAKKTKCGLCYMGNPCRNGCRPLPNYVEGVPCRVVT